jgi:hypothetical protein
MVYLLMGLERLVRGTDALQFGEAGKNGQSAKKINLR